MSDQRPGPGSNDHEDDHGDLTPNPQARSLTVSGDIGFQGKGLPPAERRRVFDSLFFEGDRRRPYYSRYTVLIVLSSLIAALGLANDSAAVVIGAMLVAPLMTPMLGSAAAIVEGWPRRFVSAFVFVIFGAVLAMIVGYLVAVLMPRLGPGSPLTDEILARTQPNLVDLAIALAAGAAGAYILVRSEASSALPGVGIAVALVPPLAAVGITTGVGETELARGALLLFITNMLAIVLAAGITFAIAGFGAYRSRQVRLEGIMAGGVLVTLLAVIAIPLGINAVQTYGISDRNRAAISVVERWHPAVQIDTIVVDPTRDPTLVRVELSGSGQLPPGEELAGLLSEHFEEPVDLAMSFRPIFRGSSSQTPAG